MAASMTYQQYYQFTVNIEKNGERFASKCDRHILNFHLYIASYVLNSNRYRVIDFRTELSKNNYYSSDHMTTQSTIVMVAIYSAYLAAK